MFLERDGERVFLYRRGVGADVAHGRADIGAAAAHEGGGAGDFGGRGGDAVGFLGVEEVGGGEAPAAVDDDADAEAERFFDAEPFDVVVAHGDILSAEVDDAHVGVAGAAAAGGVEGSEGYVAHVGLLWRHCMTWPGTSPPTPLLNAERGA